MSNPSFKIMINSQSQVSDYSHTLIKKLTIAKGKKAGVSCKAVCKDADIADAWAMFLHTINIPMKRETEKIITFDINDVEVSLLNLPKVAAYRNVRIR